MEIIFSLRTDAINSKGFAPVRINITVNSQRIRRSVPKVRVNPEDWENQRVRPNTKSEPYNYHIEYNIILDGLEHKVKELYRMSLISGELLRHQDILDCLDGKASKPMAPDIFEAMDEFLETHRAIRAVGTLKKYNASKNFIRDFERAKNYRLNFERVDQKFLENFRDYAFLERKTLNNYYGKLIAFLKTFMTWSMERGYHSNTEFKKFRTISEDIEVIYLTMDELMSLYGHEFNSRRLSMVRDLYCFACFTGLRFSDLKQLRSSNIYKEYIRLTIQKTKSLDHKIPLNKLAKGILDKYKGTIYEPIPRISGQKFNEYIKECCEIVGIDQPTTITRYVGNRRVDRTCPKYKLITSHTARKTFVTNSLILGMNERVLKNITGHNDDASFRKYLKIAEDFKSNEMINTWDKI
ncbi:MULTISPECIES: site-specific integrase [Flavobacteriaceae]|uniref:site-specific integrase n=1 Tax=Flavobacteriaceae TaxID=49546 RepID=UPI0014909F3B|nr:MULTISPECIES: site-specific integrase [Allomuricauda]MDC6367243.1 tyrosine-type recombinase/integrase [Muricauda sp. AC10]